MNRFTLFVWMAGLFWVSCAQESPKEAAAQAEEAALWAQYSALGWKDHGCELMTDAEVEAFFDFDGKATTLNARTLPKQAFCLRTWNKPDWKERETNNEKEGMPWLNPQNRLVVQLFDYDSEVHAQQQIGNLRRDRRNTYEEDVTGIGDEALWSTNTVTLLVRKGQFVLNICLEVHDAPHENLQEAKGLAQLALPKI